MIYRLGADLLVLLHAAFVCFVVLGGLLVLRWRLLAWVHLPAALWGIGIEWAGGLCPLTPWENSLRERGGQAGYSGGFLDHYLLPVLYPAGLTRQAQWLLGLFALLMNVAVYGWLLRQRHGKTREPAA